MYRGYQIISLKKESIVSSRHGRYRIDDSFELLGVGERLAKDYKDTFDRTLAALSECKDGLIDGAKLADLWFPRIEAEIFISHSHADAELATLFAGRLKRDLGITCFVDSNVWGYRDKLIDLLVQFCKYDEDSAYKGVIKTAAHVDCMLNKAIAQMMDACECLFFLNTPNSVSFAEASNAKTYSPWLATELAIYKIIQKRPHDAKPVLEIANEQYSPASGYKVYHDLRFDKVYRLTSDKLLGWIQKSHARGASKYAALSELFAATLRS